MLMQRIRVSPSFVRLLAVLALLVSSSASMWAPNAAAQTFEAVERYGVAQAGNEANFTFANEFTEPPIVVVSAQLGGTALLSSTIHTYTGGFNIFVTDHAGQPTPAAWVQWIAAKSDPAIGVQAGYALTPGGRITFDQPFSEPPIVVANAWAHDKPMTSWTVDVDRTGFNLYALDAAGAPISSNFNAYWIAVTPNAQNGFVGGRGTYSHGDSVSFSPAMKSGPAYVVSAAGGLRAGAVDNRLDGFTLSLIDSTGKPTIDGDIQWLGYAGPPATGGGNDEIGTGLDRIVATATFSGPPSASPPSTVCFDVTTDPAGANAVGSSCASGSPATTTLRGSGSPLRPGVTYYVSERSSEGWTLATAGPREVKIPAESHVAIVSFENVSIEPMAGIEQGAIVITAAVGGDGTTSLTAERCFSVSTAQDGSNPLGRVCGSGDPLTLGLGPNSPDLQTGYPYYVREDVSNGWRVYGDNPVATVIKPFGAVAIGFVIVPEGSSGGGASEFVGGDFLATVRQGSGAGRVISGHLSLGITPDGAVAQGRLVLSSGEVLTVTGSVNGDLIGLIITLDRGGQLWVTGVSSVPVVGGTGESRGWFVGPAEDDSGSWSLSNVQAEGPCGAAPCNV